LAAVFVMRLHFEIFTHLLWQCNFLWSLSSLFLF